MLRRARRAPGGSLRRYFGPDEQSLLATRQHPFALVRAAFDTFGLLLPLLVAAWGIAGVTALRGAVGDWLLRVLFLIMIVLIGRLMWRVLTWEFERVVITNEKVIHISGVLNRRIASTPLAKVSEFTVHQPLVGRIFDYGSLVVDVPGGREQALHGLSFLPDPAGMYRLVSSTARGARPATAADVAEDGDEDETRVVVPVPTTVELEQFEELWEEARARRKPDPWEPRLVGDEADHTIQIPRVMPPSDSE